MSEEKADYIAREEGEPSLTIEPERVIAERRDGEFREVVVPAFVKVSTAFKSELKIISAPALKVWLYIALSINRATGKANPGLRTIADALGVGVNTVQECLVELEGMGLLTVDRQSRKFNIYEPLGYVSANRNETVSERDTDSASVSETPESVSENGESVSASQILNQRNQREPENTARTSNFGLDWKLLHGEKITKEDLKSGKEAEIEAVVVEMERAFKSNFNRTPKVQSVARFILERKRAGEEFDQFAQWAKRDDFNASRLYEYSEQPDKIRTRWPQAFSQETETPVYPTQDLEVKNAIPNPYGRPRIATHPSSATGGGDGSNPK